MTQFPKRGMDTSEKGWSTRAEEVLLEEARVCLPLVGRLEQVRTVWKEREGGWACAPADWRTRLQTPGAPLSTMLSCPKPQFCWGAMRLR